MIHSYRRRIERLDLRDEDLIEALQELDDEFRGAKVLMDEEERDRFLDGCSHLGEFFDRYKAALCIREGLYLRPTRW